MTQLVFGRGDYLGGTDLIIPALEKQRVFPGWYQKEQPGRCASADLQESKYPQCELAVEKYNL